MGIIVVTFKFFWAVSLLGGRLEMEFFSMGIEKCISQKKGAVHAHALGKSLGMHGPFLGVYLGSCMS